jgi:signal transduction histidine kinase
MMRRLPIRTRLTAVFAVAMLATLIGVGAGTVIHYGQALDESINDTLADRARDLTTTTPGTPLSDDPDSAAQLLSADGRVLAASPRAGTTALLNPAQITAARTAPRYLDRDHAAGLSGRVRILAVPASGATVAVAAASLAARDNAVADLRTELLVALPLVLAVAIAAAYLLATAALRPVERLRAEAEAITADTPEQRLPLPPGRDEITRLGTTLNTMLDRLHTALTRERDFVADASHELRTPLALLKTELELALHRPRTPAETHEALTAALADTDRLVTLAEDLLLLARTDNPTATSNKAVAVAPLLREAAHRHLPTANGRPIQIACPDELVVAFDASQLGRAVDNLIDNAIRHGAGPIDITATATTHDAQVVLAVRDHGPGFPTAFLPHAFERFTRADTARTGPGTGLGLAIVAAVTRRHGGTAHAANHPDTGAEVSLRLPTAPDTTRPPPDMRPATPGSRSQNPATKPHDTANGRCSRTRQ